MFTYLSCSNSVYLLFKMLCQPGTRMVCQPAAGIDIVFSLYFHFSLDCSFSLDVWYFWIMCWACLHVFSFGCLIVWMVRSFPVLYVASCCESWVCLCLCVCVCVVMCSVFSCCAHVLLKLNFIMVLMQHLKHEAHKQYQNILCNNNAGLNKKKTSEKSKIKKHIKEKTQKSTNITKMQGENIEKKILAKWRTYQNIKGHQRTSRKIKEDGENTKSSNVKENLQVKENLERFNDHQNSIRQYWKNNENKEKIKKPSKTRKRKKHLPKTEKTFTY